MSTDIEDVDEGNPDVGAVTTFVPKAIRWISVNKRGLSVNCHQATSALRQTTCISNTTSKIPRAVSVEPTDFASENFESKSLLQKCRSRSYLNITRYWNMAKRWNEGVIPLSMLHRVKSIAEPRSPPPFCRGKDIHFFHWRLTTHNVKSTEAKKVSPICWQASWLETKSVSSGTESQWRLRLFNIGKPHRRQLFDCNRYLNWWTWLFDVYTADYSAYLMQACTFVTLIDLLSMHRHWVWKASTRSWTKALAHDERKLTVQILIIHIIAQY